MDYLAASLDELYVELSKDVGGELGLGDGTPQHGKAIFDQAWNKVSAITCNNDAVRVLVQDRTDAAADLITLGGLLATQFTPVVGNLVNVALLVAIVARVGIKALCASHWAQSPQAPNS